MREVYRGNGFIVSTNDCGEIFVALETSPDETLRFSRTASKFQIMLSYFTTCFKLIPHNYQTLMFELDN